MAIPGAFLAKYKWLILAAILAVILLIVAKPSTNTITQTNPSEISTVGNTSWVPTYTTQRMSANIGFVEGTDYYPLGDPKIIGIANAIAKDSTSPRDAVQKTLDYVYANVAYTYSEPDSICMSSSAVDVLNRGTGQCDTQTITVVAILREMGIAARPVGGCVAATGSCQARNALIQAAGVDIRAPKFKPITPEELQQNQFGRAATFSRFGGLHAWAEAWIDGHWVSLEPTAGTFAKTDCYNYIVELYPEDNDKLHLCVSTNYDFAKQCALA